jgi:D-alanyl-D-alanine carboxypeptidase
MVTSRLRDRALVMLGPRRTPLSAALPLALWAAAATCVPGAAASPSAPGDGATAAGGHRCVPHVYKTIGARPTPRMMRHALPRRLVARLDTAARASLKQASTPGAIVGVRSPKGTWTRAYGLANPMTGRPMAVGMHTRVGSVTKTFTGTVLLQLAQQHRLSLDDPISAYVRGVPNGSRVTLRMLADMTSGVASYTASEAFTDTYFAHPYRVFDADRLIAIGLADSPVFAPGARFDYSNTNTLLLGKVIEKVTGERLGRVFRRRIFRPLGLGDTTWPGNRGALPRPYALGFTLQGDTATPDHPSNATHWNPSWGGAAGEIISDMSDLLTYGRALGTGQGLLRPVTQAERLRSFPGEAGYGIAMGCVDGWVGHTGELPGYNTSLFYDTTTDTTVVVQANSDIASGDCPQSPTLSDDPRTLVCSAPATRIFVALSTALGHTFTPPPLQ